MMTLFNTVVHSTLINKSLPMHLGLLNNFQRTKTYYNVIAFKSCNEEHRCGHVCAYVCERAFQELAVLLDYHKNFL